MEKPREKRKSITKDLEGETELREGDREATGPSPKKKTKKKSPTSKSPRKATLHKSVDEDHHHATAEGRPPWFIFFWLGLFILIERLPSAVHRFGSFACNSAAGRLP